MAKVFFKTKKENQIYLLSSSNAVGDPKGPEKGVLIYTWFTIRWKDNGERLLIAMICLFECVVILENKWNCKQTVLFQHENAENWPQI
jgi:hypothetical protein